MIRHYKLNSSKLWTIILSCLLIAFLLIGVVIVSNTFDSNAKQISYAETITVSDLEELQNVLEDANYKTTIILEDSPIVIESKDVSLDGHGATIMVPEPFINLDGTLNDNPSDYGVFYFDDGNFSLKNMTIIGGGENIYFAGWPAVYMDAGNLTMENVTIANSNGGLHALSGNVALKNCNIIRNVREYGAGIWAGSGCEMVLDGCSLSENRTTKSGGGAMEISGKLFANNTVISNNSSAEIGGAINCYDGELFLTNCTITGNITTGGMDCGGGLGYNSEYASVIVNSIIEDNYYYNTSTNEMIRSDIGVYRDIGSFLSLVNCVYGDITGESSIVSSTDCKIDTNWETASGYREDGIMYTTRNEHEHKYTPDFKHPVLISKSIGKPEFYVPIKLTSGKAVSGGIKTYFDYSNVEDVKIGYGEESSITRIYGSDAPDSSKKVMTYYEGGERADGLIGASGAMDATFYTVKLKPLENGHVVGASIYGESYIAGTEISLKAVAKSGYALDYWAINTEVNMNNPIKLIVNEDINLRARFNYGFAIEYNANGGRGTDVETYMKGTEIKIKDASDVGVFFKGYVFSGWNTKQDGSGDTYKIGDKYTINSNIVLYAQWQDIAVANTVDLINSIGNVEYTQECKAKIDAARGAYDALSDDLKTKVSNYEVLTAAESTYAEKAAEHSNKNMPGKSLNAGAVVGIVIGCILVLVCCAYVLLFFAFNKFIIKDGKVVRVFILKKNNGNVILITYLCAKETRSNNEIFNTKKEAEYFLNK